MDGLALDLDELLASAPLDPARLALAAWLGSTAAAARLGPDAPPRPRDARELLLGLPDWTVEALVRGCVALARAVAPRVAPDATARAARARLDASTAMLDCPCRDHAAGLVAAARIEAPAAPPGPAEQAARAAEQAAFLVFHTLRSRYVHELAPVVDELLAASTAAGLGLEGARRALATDLLPWLLADVDLDEDDSDEELDAGDFDDDDDPDDLLDALPRE